MPGPTLTQARLRELLDYDPDTGVWKWRVSRSRLRPGDIAGYVRKDGYIDININQKNYRAHRLAWFYVHGHWPTHQIDHINGVPDDNRITNLREVTSVQNGRNLKTFKNNTSGYTGISRTRRNKKKPWVAQIGINGKKYHLGCFPDPEQAARYRRLATIFRFGFDPHVKR